MSIDEQTTPPKNKPNLKPTLSNASLTTGIFYLLIMGSRQFGFALEEDMMLLSLTSGLAVALTNLLRYIGSVFYVSPQKVQACFLLRTELWALEKERKSYCAKSRAPRAIELDKQIRKTKAALHGLRVAKVIKAIENDEL